MSVSGTIGVIGGGTMARAIIEGSVRAGVTDGSTWRVAEPDDDRRGRIESLGVATVRRAPDLAPATGAEWRCLLAVKPQSLASVRDDLRGCGFHGAVLSIVAGAGSDVLAGVFGPGSRIVRIMPNTPASIGLAMCAVAPGRGATDDDLALADTLFSSIGDVVRIDESLMDAFTAVAGSGPAYLFLLGEAMMLGAQDAGLDPAVARRAVTQTLLGGATLLAREGGSAEALRAAVTSRGGTTAAALEVLDRAGVAPAVRDAIIAARDRGRELGEACAMGMTDTR